MRILVNHDPHLDNYKSTLAGVLKAKGLSAVSTAKTLSISDLLNTAKQTQSQGILLTNEATLQNCVNNESGKDVTLDKYRGSRLDFSIPIIVGAPLDHFRKLRHGRWLYEKDIDKFKSISTPVTRLRYTVCKTRELLDVCLQYANSAVIASTDIETDSHSRITCVSYAFLLPNLKIICFLIPFINFGEAFWENDDDYGYAIQCMRSISHTISAKLYFNGLYDSQYQISYHAEPENFVLDSMALAHAQFSELPKSLDFVASYQLYDYYYWKDEADAASKKGNINDYWAYCARDSFNTLRVFIQQVKTAPAYAFKNYQKLFKLIYPYIYCAFEGIALDTKALEENKIKAEKIRDEAEKSLEVMADDKEFNPGSWQQVQKLLYDVIGAKPVAKPRKKKDGTWTSKRATDEKTLIKIQDQHPILNTIIDAILAYREKAKAVSTYFSFPQWKGWTGELSTPRLLYGINPFGTDTGRASSNSSSFRMYDMLEPKPADRTKSYGTQIQNIPSYAKNMLMADEGYELGEADNNKSEARCVGFLSGCTALIAALEDKTKDFYKVLGTIFFGLPYEQVTTELRNKILKRVVHGKNYLMGADTFIETVGAKILYEGARLINYPLKTLKAFATYLLSLYDKPFPEISKWYNEVKLEVLRNHTLTSPLGYTRYFFGDVIKDHKVFRNAVAHGPQNLSVDILNKGLWKVYTTIVLVENGAFRLKAQIHDSIFWQSLPHKREEYDRRVKECMYNPVMIKGREMIIPVDINHGKNWLELKS